MTLTDSILAEVGRVGCELVVTRSVDKPPIFQNFTDPSTDAEMREEEENTME